VGVSNSLEPRHFCANLAKLCVALLHWRYGDSSLCTLAFTLVDVTPSPEAVIFLLGCEKTSVLQRLSSALPQCDFMS